MVLKSFITAIALFAGFMLFQHLNPQETTLVLPGGSIYKMSVAVLSLGSVVLGAIVFYIVNLVALGRSKLVSWKRGRRDRIAREVAESLRLGLDALDSGDMKRARIQLERAHERDPFHVGAYLALSDLARAEDNFDEAFKHLQKARELDEKNLEILFRLAAIYESRQDQKNATATYEAILDLDDENRRAIAALRDLHIRQCRWKDAYEQQKELVKLTTGPRLARETDRLFYLRFEFAKLSLSVGGSDKVRSELRSIIRERPKFTPAYVTLGESLVNDGEVREAAELWENTFKELRNAIFLIRLEDLYFAQDDPSQINTLINFYKRNLLDNPRDLMLRLFFGKLCLRLEMANEALDHFTLIADSGADFPSLHILLAEAYRRKGRPNQAVDEYRKALKIGRTHRVPFTCKVCGSEHMSWASFCPTCGSWDSFLITAREELDKAAKPVENFVLLG
ncbi:MAG TPA: tetratricopeptide repeat protein [Geobacterales bacterium]|nr:tetratricopeptide repeat protein [Geobacterales bacterium]